MLTNSNLITKQYIKASWKDVVNFLANLNCSSQMAIRWQAYF